MALKREAMQMKIFAISDLHLSLMVEKPMDVFGGEWENYTEKIKENWQKTVGEDDIVLIAGDISWAMKLEETKADLDFIDKLNGTKIIIKGNHEYWWKSISAVRDVLPKSILALQNDSVKIGNYVFAGTRGWVIKESDNDPNFTEQDQKIYDRESIRLRLTLESTRRHKTDGDKVICLMHFPPFNSKREDSAFTKTLEEFNVDAVVYGHLHKAAGRYDKKYIKNNVPYHLTSCDLIGMVPVLICEE